MAVIEKRVDGRARQSVGLLPYWLPSHAASGFDLEVALTLEEARDRLDKIAQVRRTIPFEENMPSRLWGSFLATNRRGLMPQNPTRTIMSPIELQAVMLDDDTYRYQILLNEDRFRVEVRGYLKRWEGDSTVVNGRVRFKPRYLDLLFRSVLYTIGAGAFFAGTLFVLYFLSFFVRLPDAIYHLYDLVAEPNTVKILAFVVWLLALAAVWFNDVVLRANASRNQLMTRIEDMMLFSYLGK